MGEQLDGLAAGLEASPIPDNRAHGAELRISLASMRESARQWREREGVAEVGSSARSGGMDSASSVSPPESHLSVGAVAEKFKIPRRSVTYHCEHENFSATKHGGMWFIDEVSVIRYLAARRPA